MATVAKNRKAKFEFHFLDEYEAGIKLLGTEIKSIRDGDVNINDAYCYVVNGEISIKNMYIKEYENASFAQHEPRRERKLLLHKTEIVRIVKKLQDRGLTIIPTRLFINNKGFAKMNVVIAKGKKLFDKREDIKKKDTERENEIGRAHV